MIILVLFILATNCYAGPGHYECGLHGRFEYCIDDFPGCVVGCHCYPGYYFDTDTKICEPNTKLTQDYRRHLAPTSYNLHGPSGVVVPPPSPALPNFAPPDLGPPDLGLPAGDTTQDHGDLSDWLYNQFFKTIESQVVNKTDDEEPLKLGTRRSGGGGFGGPRLDNLESFLARRHRGKGRKKAKRRGSRKKILRDGSDSSDSSSGSDSESNSDDSGNLGSWERYEWGPNNPPSKDPAAHRQIVMYSKKPKPPLPSFIFLPNMQTAFYPPIGLPAPVPMYPMVPVPPITGVQTACSEEKTTSAEPTQESTTPPTTTTTLAPAASAGPPSSPLPVTDPAHTTKQALRSPSMYNLPPSLRNKNQHKPSNKPLPPPPLDFPIKQYDDFDYDAMFLGDNNFLGPEMRSNNNNDKSNFKYISDLIHHNVTTLKPPQKRDPKRYEQFFGVKPHENKKRQPISPGRLDSTRRRFDARQDGEDDSYYSSLGKQIAKLIRGLDSKGVREADIKIEPQENPKSANPFFSESSYAARTYWERFVRSPLSARFMNFTRYDDLIAGNEHLFDLENQVQGATSAPSLSWVELENIINTMGTIRNQVPGRKSTHNSHSNHSNSSFNVSLLPRFTEKRARRNHGFQTPNIKNADHTLNTPIRIVIRDVKRFDPMQKIVNPVVSDKPSKINKANKNTAGRILPGPVHVNTKFHKFRNMKPTKTPKLLTPITKEKEHDVRHAIGKNSDHEHKHNNEHKPHMIIAGQTTYVKSNKYFFDPGTNYQSENWFME